MTDTTINTTLRDSAGEIESAMRKLILLREDITFIETHGATLSTILAELDLSLTSVRRLYLGRVQHNQRKES